MAHAYRYVQSGDCRIRAAVEGSGPLVLLVHGFPESWSSWRHQIGPIAKAGFTAAAIDVRGYGGSDKPHAVEAYDMASIVADNQAVADALGGGKAILVTATGRADRNPALADRNGSPLSPACRSHQAALGSLIVVQAVHRERPVFYMVYFQDEAWPKKSWRQCRDSSTSTIRGRRMPAGVGRWARSMAAVSGMNDRDIRRLMQDEDLDYLVEVRDPVSAGR
jgi:pimeloyl-ACP methyl ester carboxylesterase